MGLSHISAIFFCRRVIKETKCLCSLKLLQICFFDIISMLVKSLNWIKVSLAQLIPWNYFPHGDAWVAICSYIFVAYVNRTNIAFAQAIISRTFDNDDVDSDNDHGDVDDDDPSINDGEFLCRMRHRWKFFLPHFKPKTLQHWGSSS